MDDAPLIEALSNLAEQNVSGVAFLGAYGLTWMVCAVFWKKASERTAAYATLFQGLVAFPLALALSFVLGALGTDRPVPDSITQLSILIGTSQLLGLPFMVYLIVKREYTLTAFAFAVITSMHFVLYSWLYQTPVYIGMAVLIVVGTSIVMFMTPDERSRRRASRVCAVTAALLLATALAFVVLHLA